MAHSRLGSCALRVCALPNSPYVSQMSLRSAGNPRRRVGAREQVGRARLAAPALFTTRYTPAESARVLRSPPDGRKDDASHVICWPAAAAARSARVPASGLALHHFPASLMSQSFNSCSKFKRASQVIDGVQINSRARTVPDECSWLLASRAGQVPRGRIKRLGGSAQRDVAGKGKRGNRRYLGRKKRIYHRSAKRRIGKGGWGGDESSAGVHGSINR